MKWFTPGRGMAALLVLTLIVGAGNLAASYSEVRAYKAQQRTEQAAQQRQGVIIGRKICTTMQRLAALQPPPGNPASNPSRAFEDKLHVTLDQLGPDLGCK